MGIALAAWNAIQAIAEGLEPQEGEPGPSLLPEWQRELNPEGYYNLGLAHRVPGIIALLGQTFKAGVQADRVSELLEGAVTWFLDQKGEGVMDNGVALLRERSRGAIPLGEALRAAEKEGRLGTPLDALAGSYLHMHANRMLRAAARAQELVLYDFLKRIYESRLARNRKNVPAKA